MASETNYQTYINEYVEARVNGWRDVYMKEINDLISRLGNPNEVNLSNSTLRVNVDVDERCLKLLANIYRVSEVKSMQVQGSDDYCITTELRFGVLYTDEMMQLRKRLDELEKLNNTKK